MLKFEKNTKLKVCEILQISANLKQAGRVFLHLRIHSFVCELFAEPHFSCIFLFFEPKVILNLFLIKCQRCSFA